MKTRFIVLIMLATVVVATVLVVAFASAGRWLLGGSPWRWCAGQAPAGSGLLTVRAVEPVTIQEAQEAVERYVDELGYRDLEVSEVMEFAQNYYAMVEERGTGLGAMELLVDKRTGGVGPEYGPNMMWNARYGMHRGGMMWGGGSGKMTVSPEEARQKAQRWLDAYRPGSTVEPETDTFYGYYTLHTLRDGQIDGMLSVHGRTGQVWYHTWHGAFIQMVEGEDA